MTALFLTLIVSLAAQAPAGVALPRAVPYLPQTEALCGGAAAAMVMRYWDDTTARPEMFAPLIDPALDGIVTTALVSDLQRRGWQAFPLRGSAEDDGAMRQHLSRGRPIIALIEDRPSRYHYVVVTAIDAARVHFHDPAIAPDQRMTREEFGRRWRAANFWMLLLLPGSAAAPGLSERAEPELAAAVGALLRAGKTDEALRMATAAARATPSDPVAWDAMATSLFVMDRELEALDAWNRAGKPDIDTVQVSGLRHTRFRVIEQLTALASGDRLTASSLARARRRVALAPSSIASRVGYVPLSDGRVQIDAAIVERARMPGLSDVLFAAAKAPFSRDIELSLTNLVGGGERVTGSWRFREGFERIAAAIDTPAPLPFGAVWRITGFDARETFAVHGVPFAQRRQHAGAEAIDWISGSIGWKAGAGFERWPESLSEAGGAKLYATGTAMVAAGSWLDADVTAEGWMRGAGATRLSGRARATVPAGGGRLALMAGASGVHGRTPAFLFPGAGDGHLRAPLLRAHPLVHDGTINVDEGQIFGRRLLHGTVEWTRPVARLALAALDVAVFTDAARGWQLLDSRAADYQIDAGAGLRLRLLGGGPAFRLDLARGLRDGRWALSAGLVYSR